jgi:hypothetical protein
LWLWLVQLLGGLSLKAAAEKSKLPFAIFCWILRLLQR